MGVLSRRDEMARGPYKFTEADVRRAVRATESAGLTVARIEIDKAGKISLIPGSSSNGAQVTENALDEWTASHARPA